MATSITIIDGDDLIKDSRADINNNFDSLLDNKIETDVLSTDSTFAGASDTKIASQLATKLYVDSGGNQNASETTRGIVQEASDAQVTAGTATGSTGAKLFVTPAKLATRTTALLATKTLPIVRSYAYAASPATWTKPAGLSFIDVEIWGGGGAGAAGTYHSCGGGGAYNRKRFLAADLGDTETITIGAGGAVAGNNLVGSDGGTTSFGTKLYAYGGGAGGVNSNNYGGGGGGIYGVGTSGATGVAGGAPLGGATTGVASTFGGGAGGTNANGGASVYGGGGGGGAGNTGGVSQYGGAGGSGSSGTAGAVPAGGGGSHTSGNTPGAGGNGQARVIEYYS